ncbi:DUF1207 domain-containing protein [Allorhodopirellula heiligendammensis]|uniref:DUF1207 domain-containing protein n=1 Tax=Allorhodopirellula heiligendammensis TaxID=2714739 RepID=A0A5C6C4C9_9BACT|nr:DUF1207 domain-containing protein [Allorhodopirellula heiligendammensis]TWU19460.1 hypothetical protein Poly21_16330 [Allorhodopirellula heiligendammensis]
MFIHPQCRTVTLWMRLVSAIAFMVPNCWEAAGDEPPRLFVAHQQALDQIELESEAVSQRVRPNEDQYVPEAVTDFAWHLLPDGLLWRSYLAGPHEPRISTVIFKDNNGGVFWDATLGGRVGLLRYGTAGAKHPSGIQWDLEGATITRLDIMHAEDVESLDYRFGTEITAADGPWAIKVGYFHISSHVGDEYLVRNPAFQRINYVTESWIIGGSYAPSQTLRLYGEFANAFRASGGAKRYQFQTGAEYTPVARSPRVGAPFAAVNLNFREAVDGNVSTTVQVGWSFQGPVSGRRLRFGAQYGDGPTSQYSFFQRRESYLGFGTWFDY